MQRSSLFCYNTVPQTGWIINNGDLFSTVLKGGSPTSGCQHGQVLLRALFCAADCRLLIISLHARKRGTELFGVPFIRALVPFIRVSASLPNYFPKAPLPITITFQHMNFGEHKHSVHKPLLQQTYLNISFPPNYVNLSSSFYSSELSFKNLYFDRVTVNQGPRCEVTLLRNEDLLYSYIM